MPVLNQRRRVGILLSACSFILLLASSFASAQNHSGILKGKIIDGLLHKTIYNASISADSASKGITSMADGSYHLRLGKGAHTLYFRHEGYQVKIVTDVNIPGDEVSRLDIILYPLTSGSRDTLLRVPFYAEVRRSVYNPVFHADGVSDRLEEKSIQAGTDRDGAGLLQRLSGVIIQNTGGYDPLFALNVFGLGERYNQVLFDGAPLPSFNTAGRAWPLDLIPAETITEASVQRTGVPSTPAEYAGGAVSIRTRDMPDQNFFYVRAGGGWSERSSPEWLGFPGSGRGLPGSFPTSQSLFSLNQLNPQAQVDQWRLLRNNLAPVSHGSSPDERVILGFGRLIQLKKGEKIGILAYINHYHDQRIDGSTVQAAPDMSALYPLADGSRPLILSMADDVSYHDDAQTGATLNASILFGRNKISLRNFFSQRLSNTYTRRERLFKTGEDSMAHTGINYLTEQTLFLNTQLSGEHALGGDGKFKMSWQASYAYLRRQDPDQRNFLLRQDSADNSLFEIARPQSPAYDPNTVDLNAINTNFTNSGREWRDNKEHNFTGSVDIHTPFEVGGLTQTLSGGVYIRTRFRNFNDDLYLIKGPGYFPLDELLSRERYYPGGLSVQNFYTNAPANLNFIYPNNRASYQSSENLGAAYLLFENRLPGDLFLNWGFRLESGSQLISNIRYVYSDGFKYPQVSTLDENTKVTNTVLLPSVTAGWQPFHPLRIQASYFQTISRPEIQEMGANRHYDPLSFMVTTGNATLSAANIDNYGGEVSYQPYAGARFAVSGFYKKIDQPIGYIVTPFSTGNLIRTPYNMPPATVKGLTADLKFNFGVLSNTASWLSWLSAYAGGTWLKSNVSAGPVRNLGKTAEHSLEGTPDHTINAGVVFQHPRFPMINVLYHRTGDYLIASGSGTPYVTNGKTVMAVPDYRMKERDNLDIQVAQKFWHSRIQLIAGVNNVTNSAAVEYQDLNGNKKFDRPLSLAILDNSGGYLRDGVDNTVLSLKPQRTYYVTISYLFK